MSTSIAGVVVFYGLVALTLAGAAWVAFARNIVHSAFALLGNPWQELYRDETELDAVYYLSPRRKGQRIIAQRLYEQITGEAP